MSGTPWVQYHKHSHTVACLPTYGWVAFLTTTTLWPLSPHMWMNVTPSQQYFSTNTLTPISLHVNEWHSSHTIFSKNTSTRISSYMNERHSLYTILPLTFWLLSLTCEWVVLLSSPLQHSHFDFYGLTCEWGALLKYNISAFTLTPTSSHVNEWHS